MSEFHQHAAILERLLTPYSTAVLLFRGRPDDTWGGSYGFFGKKRDCLAKSDEKIVCSANCQTKKFVHKTVRKMGFIQWRKKICLFLCLRAKKRFCFWLGVKKQVCPGEKTHSLPHISSGSSLSINKYKEVQGSWEELLR